MTGIVATQPRVLNELRCAPTQMEERTELAVPIPERRIVR